MDSVVLQRAPVGLVIIVPVCQTSEPGRWQFSLFPGITTSGSYPFGIDIAPNLGVKYMSTSSRSSEASSR